MFQIFLYLSLIILIQSTYKELKKHGSVEVVPGTQVYFDLRKFDVGELLEFEITMDLFFGDAQSKSKYEFYIEQVPANNYYDSTYWNINNLRKVTDTKVSCESDGECTFSWEEIKKEGMNYIYIIPIEPFYGFYTLYDEEIEIEHLGGGLSAGAIAGIVIGCVAFVAIIVIIIVCCCCRCNPGCQTCCYNCCPCCHCCFCCCPNRTVRPGIITGPSAVSVAVANPIYPQPVYPQPVYPQPVYQPAIPYSSGGYI